MIWVRGYIRVSWQNGTEWVRGHFRRLPTYRGSTS